jgi:hypothetical protein
MTLQLTLFKETVVVYCDNHKKHKYTLWAQFLNVKACFNIMY